MSQLSRRGIASGIKTHLLQFGAAVGGGQGALVVLEDFEFVEKASVGMTNVKASRLMQYR